MSECQVYKDIKWWTIEGYRSRLGYGRVSHGYGTWKFSASYDAIIYRKMDGPSLKLVRVGKAASFEGATHPGYLLSRNKILPQSIYTAPGTTPEPEEREFSLLMRRSVSLWDWRLDQKQYSGFRTLILGSQRRSPSLINLVLILSLKDLRGLFRSMYIIYVIMRAIRGPP